MEKNIALNLREVADKVNEENEKQKVKLHREFIEAKVIPYLQENAEEGRYKASFPSTGYNFMLLRDILCEIGFTVETYNYNKTRCLMVKW